MVKIDIISGFLGAGKTTLIKKLLKEAFQDEQVVLIENEFGEIGIDGGFLKEAGIEIREMNSGCICCSLVGDFGTSLKEVVSKYNPDRILIEPSGVGKLSDVIKAVQGVQDEVDIKLNSYTTVVDAKKCRMYMRNFGEFFNNQVEHASSIILSHTAGMDEEKLEKAVDMLREHNPHATIIATDWEKLSGKQILDAMEKKDTLEEALHHLEEEHEHHHDHEHHDHDHDHEHHHDHEHEHGDSCSCGCGHDHGHHHADEVFTSWGVETPKKFTEAEVKKALNEFDEDASYGTILRAKGFVDASDGKWIYFDYVPGEADVRRGEPAVTGRVCVIGSKINEQAIKELFGIE